MSTCELKGNNEFNLDTFLYGPCIQKYKEVKQSPQDRAKADSHIVKKCVYICTHTALHYSKGSYPILNRNYNSQHTLLYYLALWRAAYKWHKLGVLWRRLKKGHHNFSTSSIVPLLVLDGNKKNPWGTNFKKGATDQRKKQNGCKQIKCSGSMKAAKRKDNFPQIWELAEVYNLDPVIEPEYFCIN